MTLPPIVPGACSVCGGTRRPLVGDRCDCCDAIASGPRCSHATEDGTCARCGYWIGLADPVALDFAGRIYCCSSCVVDTGEGDL